MGFKSSMAAKKFLVSRIVEEANREQIPLSETEQKMLYFSESFPTLPDIEEVAQRFESECNDKEYEKKISRLSKAAYKQDRRESPELAQQWRDAVQLLKSEDHYILVMVSVGRRPHDIIKLFLAAILVVAVGAPLTFGWEWITPTVLRRIPYSVQVTGFLVFIAVVFFLGLDDKAGKKVGDWLGNAIERLVRW